MRLLESQGYFIHSLAVDGGGRDDLDAEGGGQAGVVELDAAQPGFIGHIEGQNQRHAHLGQLAGEQQGAAQVLGVAHLQDGLERLEQQDALGHFFVFGIGGEGDDAGRIDQRHAGQRPRRTARALQPWCRGNSRRSPAAR